MTVPSLAEAELTCRTLTVQIGNLWTEFSLMWREGAKIYTTQNIQISEPKTRPYFFENTVKKSRGSSGQVTISETQRLFLVPNTVKSAPHTASNVNTSYSMSFANVNSSSAEGKQARSTLRICWGLWRTAALKTAKWFINLPYLPFFCCSQQAAYLPKSS